MSTTKQKQAARKNIKKAQQARAEGARGSRSPGLSTAAKKFGVEVEADDWREPFAGGKARKR